MTAIENLIGSRFNDKLTGDGVDNIIEGGAGNDLLSGGANAAGGAAHAIGNIENVMLTGTAALNLTGNGLDNVLAGNAGINTLTGAGGNDTLDGGGAADTMLGGAGNDIYMVDDTGDVVDETGGDGIDTVRASVTFSLANTVHVKSTVENLHRPGRIYRGDWQRLWQYSHRQRRQQHPFRSCWRRHYDRRTGQ